MRELTALAPQVEEVLEELIEIGGPPGAEKQVQALPSTRVVSVLSDIVSLSVLSDCTSLPADNNH